MKKENKTKKSVRYTYWFAYADNNNKLQNAIADCRYLINSREKMFQAQDDIRREKMFQAQDDIRRETNGNFRAFYNFQLLGKKYVTEQGEVK